ncbi:hypothetical protein ABQX22_02695 [Xanthomonas sp. WHRI 1810A]|jgi:hypothetical protein|uniref:hypothetical protein n=1 Tax=Xanthomonas sp. WHRI 1810A TaxID=3161565 RepID=UPI0032E8EB97
MHITATKPPNQVAIDISNGGKNLGKTKGDTFEKIFESASNRGQAAQDEKRVAARLQERSRIMQTAKADPEEAKKLAYGYAHNSLTHALLDVSDRPNIRYAATGELVTPITEAYFSKISRYMQEKSAFLYNSEIERGTSSAEILEKIFSFHDSMPETFKNMLAI